MDSVGIFGYGRFGQLLAQLLSDQFHVKIHDPKNSPSSNKLQFVDNDTLLKEKTIFIAVPIRHFENLIKEISQKLSDETTLLDTCSVKTYPVEVMKKYLPENIGIIATHPLFGPDSINSKEKLNFVMHNVRDPQHCYEHWKNFFSNKFNVVEITPDDHDRLAAKSQGIIHFVARMLEDTNIQSTPIDTHGFKELLTLVENNSHDTWELFSDLQNYNPYSKAMIQELEQSFQHIKRHIIEAGEHDDKKI